MQNIIILLTILGAHLLAVISPGPDFVMAVKNSLSYSRRIGIWTAVGFGLGIMVHIIYSLAGLALIISQSILIFNVIKYMGAGYLIYIGLKSLLSKKSHINIHDQQKKKEISKWQAIKMGFLTNALNPKATLFFLSLFTLIISPDTPNSILAIASVMMVIDTILWFSLVAIFFTQKAIRQGFDRFQGLFNKTFGGLLVLLGVKVALSDN